MKKLFAVILGVGISTFALAGSYQIYKDKGRAASWEWFDREVVLKCSNGDMPSVYLNKHGKWEAKGSSYSTFEQAASAACD